MKTTKVILVSALMALVMMGFAQKEAPLDTKRPAYELSASISLKSALQNQGLVWAMREQLRPEFLVESFARMYTVTVYYNNVVYQISGSYKAWKHFFSIKKYAERKEG